jgi:dihydrofolate reductase
MRKLKLQVQMSLDGFVAGPNGELDWMWIVKPDEAILHRVIELAETCDIILLGRKMTPGFIEHWENVVDNHPESHEQPLARQMVNMRKIVFSRTQPTIQGRNVEVESGDVVAAVKALKQEPGKDIMVYGGAAFVSSLIAQNLVDEYYIFRRPVAIGKGLSIFHEQKVFELNSSITYKNGTVLHKYLPIQTANQ